MTMLNKYFKAPYASTDYHKLQYYQYIVAIIYINDKWTA